MLGFVDVKLIRNCTGALGCSVYRKPAHTDRCLNFLSDHPLQHKQAVAKILLSGAKLFASNERNHEEDNKRIRQDLNNSGHPTALTTCPQRSTSTEKPLESRTSLVYYRTIVTQLKIFIDA